MEIDKFGLYNITIKIENIDNTDNICVFGIKNCILYYGKINKINNIISFNYSHNIYINNKNIILDTKLLSKKINLYVIGKKIYDYKILNYNKIDNTQKLIILGDSHSYMHGEICKYFSWAQYFPYILNKNIEIINLSIAGQGGAFYYNDINTRINISKLINKQTIVLSIFGAIDKKRIFRLNESSLNEYEFIINDFFKYLNNYTNNIYLCKMYPSKNRDKIITRSNVLEDIYKNINDITYFNIDTEVLNDKNYINGFNINCAHTGILGGIIVGNILRNKLKSFGLNIFNDNNLNNDVNILELKKITKLFVDNFQLIRDKY